MSWNRLLSKAIRPNIMVSSVTKEPPSQFFKFVFQLFSFHEENDTRIYNATKTTGKNYILLTNREWNEYCLRHP